MRELVRALGDNTEPLSCPWPSLVAAGVRPTPGNLVVVQAAPGVGKSLFALSWALSLAEPSYVMSLDTDPRSQALRVVANLTSTSITEVERDAQRWASWLADQRHTFLRWGFSGGLAALDERLDAEVEFWGTAPRFVVVDNVSNVVTEESAQGYWSAYADLHAIAREHNVVLIALTHVRRNDGADGTRAITMASSRYAGEAEAEVVLGLWRPDPQVLTVGILKNRMGPASPDGSRTVSLSFDAERSRIRELQPRLTAVSEGTLLGRFMEGGQV